MQYNLQSFHINIHKDNEYSYKDYMEEIVEYTAIKPKHLKLVISLSPLQNKWYMQGVVFPFFYRIEKALKNIQLNRKSF